MIKDDTRPLTTKGHKPSRLATAIRDSQDDTTASNLFRHWLRDPSSKGDSATYLSQQVFDALTAEMAVLDQHGCVLSANKAWRTKAEKVAVSRGAERPCDLAPLDFLTTDGPTARRLWTAVTKVLSGACEEAALSFKTKDSEGRRRHGLRVASLKMGPDRGAVVIVEDTTEVHELLRDRRLLTDQLMRSEEQERRRIAREMHDSTVQDLVAIGLNLSRLRHLNDDPIAQEVLADVRMILKRTQQDVRTLSYLLHPPLLDEGGLRPALEALLHGLTARMKIRIDFESNAVAIRLPIDVEMALYRVTQEALINVHKHASATRALVHYHVEADQALLIIEDDGVGLDRAAGSHVGSGVGIQGMKARMRELGGTLTLSTIKHGTRLRAMVSLKAASGP